MPNARARAYEGKHRRRRARRNANRFAAITAAGTLMAAASTLGTAEAATADDFARLRMCESSGNYRINTGNGYYGAYQFDLQTWHGLGYGGRPDQASPSTQDAAARRLQADRGWQPWPACSRKLGLRSGTSTTVSRASSRVSLTGFHANLLYRPVSAPAFHGVTLRKTLVGSVRADVRAWQAQMKRRGWTIAVDGRFGPKSAAVAAAFRRQQHVSAVGIVGRVTWRLTWEAPIK
ncbi:MAG: Transglycosylase-like domain protein [Frankiales bacterium]|nr:Transglycosylase-like domain protein [Frankiales bacterium]